MARSSAARLWSVRPRRPPAVAVKVGLLIPVRFASYGTPTTGNRAGKGRLYAGRVLDPITRGWAVVTSAGVVRLGLGFVASLIIARALGPADFGIYAVLAATVGIVGSLAEGGLTEAAVLRMSAVWPGSPSRAMHRARAFWWLRLLLAGSVVAVGCLVARELSAAFLQVDEGLLRWALLGIVATAASGGGGAREATTRAVWAPLSLPPFKT